jgi:hypothetical protein
MTKRRTGQGARQRRTSPSDPIRKPLLKIALCGPGFRPVCGCWFSYPERLGFWDIRLTLWLDFPDSITYVLGSRKENR